LDAGRAELIVTAEPVPHHVRNKGVQRLLIALSPAAPNAKLRELTGSTDRHAGTEDSSQPHPMIRMTLHSIPPSLRQWFNSLKFKIMAMAIVTAVLAAGGTAQLVLATTQTDLERLLLRNDADDGERTAVLLSHKLEMLKLTVAAVARQAGREALWSDRGDMVRFLADKPAAGALFDFVIAARADGEMLARLEKTGAAFSIANIADREYFQRALKSERPVVARPYIGRLKKVPFILIAMRVTAADGTVLGVVAGSLELRSAGLFSNLGVTSQSTASRSLVVDREGLLLAHPDPARVLGQAADEPGLAEVLALWRKGGAPIESEGRAMLSGSHMIAMAGIPASDWLLVRMTPLAEAFEPVAAARRTAWRAAAVVGVIAGLLAAVLAWVMTRPIVHLRARAQAMLTETSLPGTDWPRRGGEVGDLAQAFKQVVEQRQQRQSETQAMLHQIEAVLDHAEVGIALTRNGRFELVSRQFCHVFRCEKQHVIGQATRLIHSSDEAYQSLSDRARPAFMEHGAFDGELELMRRSGQTFWAHMRGRAVVPGDRSQGTIWTIEDVTEVREQRERMAWTSSHDSLTGLANRAAFEVLLERATVRAEEEPFCALFIDLDRFKLVNDTGGHAAGDALLRDVANELAAQVRKSDTVARLGGDEFAVLLSACPLAQAEAIAEKLRSAVVAYQLLWEGHVFGVGASIGLVPVDASYATPADVLRAADAACYAAKRQGRNCVAVHGAAPAPRHAELADTGVV
jgi:diguanylate cyclase